MLKFGNICDLDAANGLCRVEFDEDGIVSDWLPLLVKNSFNTKSFFIFEIGEHVATMMDENAENGVILGAIYSSDRKPNGGKAGVRRTVYKDGSTFEFDENNGNLTIDIKGDVIIKSAGSVSVESTGETTVKALSTQIEAATNTVKGPLIVEGLITAQGGISASGGSGAALTIDGDVDVQGGIDATSDIKSGSISLKTHVHGGVQPGGGSTATPT